MQFYNKLNFYMKSIQETTKQWVNDNKVKWAVIVMLTVTMLSFGIGYLVGKESSPAPIIIKQGVSSSTEPSN